MASIITADTGAVSGTAGLKQSADSSGVLALATGTGTTAVTIDASQNVGIGVTPSTMSAGVKAIQIGTGSADGFLYGLGGNDTEITTNAYFNSGYKYQTSSIAATRYYQSAGIHSWSTAASGTAGNAITFAESMRIDTSGRLLVNGTTATPYSALGASIVATGIAGSQYAASFTMPTTSSTGSIIFVNPNGTVGSVTTSGSTTAYATSSDYRLKENVRPMTDALSLVQQLNPCAYTWKSDGSSGQGFIAHELQAVVPDCVTGEKDAVDKDGNPVYQGIDTSFLVATLTAAIQEQQALITTLTERITALEAK